MNFKKQFRDLQELIREYFLLRKHNMQFKEKDPQNNLLLFSEASLAFVILERFLRILPEVQSANTDTLHNLFEKATSKSRQVLKIDKKKVKEITDLRNCLQHGNYEQVAKSNQMTVEEYFKKKFVKDIEKTFNFTDELFKQIDPNTGKVKK